VAITRRHCGDPGNHDPSEPSSPEEFTSAVNATPQDEAAPGR
jgi:hypothetical protein